MKVVLTYPTPQGSKSIELSENEHLVIGRSPKADLYFDNESLSRIHASIYRESERIWIIDENSTNGTFVNGNPTSPTGTLLKNGDLIRLGKDLEISVRIIKTDFPKPQKHFSFLPVAIVTISAFILIFAIAFIVIEALTAPEKTKEEKPKTEDLRFEENEKSSKNPTPEKNFESGFDSDITKMPNVTPVQTQKRKKFFEMTEAEKDEYIRDKAEKISRIIGNQVGEPIPNEAIRTIKVHLQGYINRIRQIRTDNCQQGSFTKSDLVTILERASKNAPFIIRSFYSEGLDPQIGIYIAMIESEHCPCLQSPTGALGMFQFVRSTGREFGLQIKQDASPTNPDERCDPEKSAKAAARYLKSLISRFGSGPMSFPLAIASYNSGQGGLSQNLEKALKAAADQERSFWTLVANQTIFEGKVGEQFRKENVKYVPKFFAAAIIGENPQDFGINMAPISTYTR